MDTDALQHDRSNLVVELCADNASIEFNGKKYTPDKTKGYFRFSCGYAFPNRNAYGTSCHPNVLALSYQSLRDQDVNYEHKIREYHKVKNPNVQDRVIGCVLDVTFPATPPAGWKIQPSHLVDPQSPQSPHIEGLGVFFKMMTGMDKIFGDHATGREKHSVSRETDWYFDEDCGFVLPLALKNPKVIPLRPISMDYAPPLFKFSPQDFLDAGFEYVPFDKAPAELIACYSKKLTKVVAQYKGREVTVLEGGLSTTIHFNGLAIARIGAEPNASLIRMAASLSQDHPVQTESDPLVEPFSQLAKLLAETAKPK